MLGISKLRTSSHHQAVVTVDGINVLVLYKNIKSLRLRVLPPDGVVKLSAPLYVDKATVENFLRLRLSWIQLQQARIAALPKPDVLQYCNGESILYLGKCYCLKVIEGKPSITLTADQLILSISKGSTILQRARLLDSWYRQQLKQLIPQLLDKWQPVVNQHTAEWGVKKMKTRWGSCNIRAKRIWLNLELVKKPQLCLEMVLVHELTHLHEPRHNKNFYRLMDQFMPEWRKYDALLEAGCL